jgi:large conductance mechanosensitive channel
VLKDFRVFVLRGNVVDLAVGVVVGAAFGAVVTSLVSDLITPVLSIPGTTNFAELDFTIRDSVFAYGRFLNALISFLTIAAAVFFLVVVPMNRLMTLRRTGTDVEEENRECPECLSSIPRRARRCAFCTAQVTPLA